MNKSILHQALEGFCEWLLAVAVILAGLLLALKVTS